MTTTSVYGIHEDSSTALTPLSRKKCIFRGALYYEEGAQRTIELMARGDFNYDGMEDWLISARYGVEGGAYRSFRMNVITKTTIDGKIQLVEEISS